MKKLDFDLDMFDNLDYLQRLAKDEHQHGNDYEGNLLSLQVNESMGEIGNSIAKDLGLI